MQITVGCCIRYRQPQTNQGGRNSNCHNYTSHFRFWCPWQQNKGHLLHHQHQHNHHRYSRLVGYQCSKWRLPGRSYYPLPCYVSPRQASCPIQESSPIVFPDVTSAQARSPPVQDLSPMVEPICPNYIRTRTLKNWLSQNSNYLPPQLWNFCRTANANIHVWMSSDFHR